MADSNLPDRPNLEKSSVAFSAINGVGWGAAAGAGLGAVRHAIGKVRNVPGEAGLAEKVFADAVNVGATVGLIDGFSTYHVNRQKAATKPYVERLEQELVAKSMTTDPNTPQR